MVERRSSWAGAGVKECWVSCNSPMNPNRAAAAGGRLMIASVDCAGGLSGIGGGQMLGGLKMRQMAHQNSGAKI